MFEKFSYIPTLILSIIKRIVRISIKIKHINRDYPINNALKSIKSN